MTDFGMSRIIPEKIQDIEKGVEAAEGRGSPEKPHTKSQAVVQQQENQTAEEKIAAIASDQKGDTADPTENQAEDDENEPSEKKKKVNFNEGANVSWERESILNPDDSTERHSNLLVDYSMTVSISLCIR